MSTNDIEMQIVARDRCVHLLFNIRLDDGHPIAAQTDHMILEPPVALVAAQTLTDMAFEADASLKPVGSTLKASMVEKHRAVLIPRLTLVLNTQRERKKVTNELLAKQIMDAVCAEIF